MLCSTNEIANVVTSMTVGDCSRSGRKTVRSISERERDHDREAGDDAPQQAARSDVYASV